MAGGGARVEGHTTEKAKQAAHCADLRCDTASDGLPSVRGTKRRVQQCDICALKLITNLLKGNKLCVRHTL